MAGKLEIKRADARNAKKTGRLRARLISDEIKGVFKFFKFQNTRARLSAKSKMGQMNDRRPPPRRDPLASTESRLEAISRGSLLDGQWVRRMVEREDPRGQRNAAIRAAAALLLENSKSATAKRLAYELSRYLANGAWLRAERNLENEPANASPLRVQLWRIAKLTNGEGVSWRLIFDLIEFVE